MAAEAHLFDRVERRTIAFTRLVASIGVLGMLIASGVTVVDVLLRWLISSGVPALNEIVSMTFAVAVAACIPAGLANRVGITIDIIERALTKRTAAQLRLIGGLLLLLFFAVLTWSMSNYAASLVAQGRMTVILNLPHAPFIWTTTVLLAISTLVQAVVALSLLRTYLETRQLPSEPRSTTDYVALSVVIALGLFAIFTAANLNLVSGLVQDYPATSVLTGFALLWICLLGILPLAAVMGLIGISGAGLMIGFLPASSALATEAAGFLTNYHVATLPLFLMMGSFAAVAGVSDDVYRLAQALLGRFRGGLGMATIGGCAGFGAVTGSSLATVATFGRVSLPQMQSRKYAPEFAAGCVAAGGTLGALIPPSAPLIIFALLTEASIGQLFIAAIVPGLIATGLYITVIAIQVRLRPDIAPAREKVEASEVLAAFRQSGAVIALFGTVIGGMYSGVFTATEAAGVGAFGAFLIALVRGKLRASVLAGVMSETTTSVALIYMIIFGVLIFSFFIGVSGLPEQATAFFGSLDVAPIIIIVLILLCYLMLGAVMDSFTVMIITVPIVTPVILHLGYDMVWWGVINLVIVEIGLITPPFGLHLFVLKSMMPDIPLERLYRGVLPFCFADFLKLALLLAFPILALWLPLSMAR